MNKNTIKIMLCFCILFFLAGCRKTKDNAELREYHALEYVTLGEYKNMEVTVQKKEVTETEIKEYIETLLATYPGYTDTNKAKVEVGDSVNIDYQGLLNGVEFEGGTEKGYVLKIGSDAFIDGFEEGLIGAKIGEKRTLNLTFPNPYNNNPKLSGKEVVFHVVVNKIVNPMKVTYDTLSDEYVKNHLSFMGYDTVQKFKEGVRSYLEEQNDYYAQNDVSDAIVEKLKQICKVKIDTKLLNGRVNEYEKKYEDMCAEQYNLSLSEVLEQQYQMTEEEFHAEIVEYTKENMETDLILLAIAEKENIRLDEEGYEKFVDNMLANYALETKEALYTQYGEAYVKDSYLCNIVMTKLIEEATINYV